MSTQNPFFSYCMTYPDGIPIPSGSSTPFSKIELGGSGPSGSPFVILDNGGVVASGVFNQSGAFIQQFLNLAPGPHRFELKENTSLPSTHDWTLTVIQSLSVDTSLLVLNGVMIRSAYCPHFNGVDAIGNTALRQASGGKPSYHYQSSNQQVATVDANGKVTGMGNGTATITITDQSNAQVSYSVAVSNVYSLLVHGGLGWTYARYTQSLTQRGQVRLTQQIRDVMARCFFPPWFKWGASPKYPHLANAWTGVTSGAYAEVYNTDTGIFGWLAQTADPHSGLSFSLKNAGAIGGLEAVESSEVREIMDEQPVDDQ